MTRTIKSRRALRLLALSSVVGLTLTGCSLFGTDSNSEGSSEDVELTIAIVPDPPGASAFYAEQFAQFEEDNPGVTVKVIENPADQQTNAIELMFQQGNAPDVFRAQGDQALDSLVQRGWALPLDDLETPEFLERFPEGSFDPAVSGLHRDGTLYSLPLTWGDWAPLNVLIWNEDLLSAAGIDEAPETWSEFADAAEAVSAQGDGKVFGTAPTMQNGLALGYFGNTAAPASLQPAIDLTDGSPQAADPQLVELVELWSDLQRTGGLEPGWESWDGTKAFTEFAAGRLAMYPAPAWNVAEIRKLNPEISMGLAPIPVPDSGRVAYAPRTSSFAPLWSASAETEHPAETLRLMDFLVSSEFLGAYYDAFGTLTASPAAWEDAVAENPDQSALVEIAAETIRAVPNPALGDTGAKEFWATASGNPDLDWKTLALDSIITGSDYESAAQALDQKLADMIAEMAEADPDAADALANPDWDPLEEYTAP